MPVWDEEILSNVKLKNTNENFALASGNYLSNILLNTLDNSY